MSKNQGKKMKIFLLIFLSFCAFPQLNPEWELDEFGKPHKRIDDLNKRLYLQNFKVTFQIGLVLSESQQGGRQFGGGVSGDTKATLAVAVPDLDGNQLQQITDELYNKYIDKLKSLGFEFVNLDEIWDSELYTKKRSKRWMRRVPVGPQDGMYWGNIVYHPTGYEFIQPVSSTGFRTNMILGQTAQKLDVTPCNVYIIVKVFENGESMFGQLVDDLSGASSVEIETNFQIAKESRIDFMGYIGFKPDDLEISGILEDQEFEQTQLADIDRWGTDYGIAGSGRVAYTLYSAENLEKYGVNVADCKPEDYIRGAKLGANVFLDSALSRIEQYIKK